MKKSSVEDLLATVPLFEGFSRKELRHVAGQMREQWFNRGEDIVTEGEKGGGFYVIAEGQARVIVGGKARRTAGPGSHIGEMSLIDGAPRSATVRAETNVKVLHLGTWNFLSLLEENFTMVRKLMAEMSRRIRALEKSATA